MSYGFTLNANHEFECAECEQTFEYEIDNDGIWDIKCPNCQTMNQYEVR